MKTYTKQEAFDIIWEHAKKKEPGHVVIEGIQRCRLRGYQGSRCFVGALISDEEYRPEMEDKVQFPSFFCSIVPDGDFFLNELRKIHDHRMLETWERELRLVARDFNLTIPGER